MRRAAFALDEGCRCMCLTAGIPLGQPLPPVPVKRELLNICGCVATFSNGMHGLPLPSHLAPSSPFPLSPR